VPPIQPSQTSDRLSWIDPCVASTSTSIIVPPHFAQAAGTMRDRGGADSGGESWRGLSPLSV
jgi:hypothetical protein